MNKLRGIVNFRLFPMRLPVKQTLYKSTNKYCISILNGIDLDLLWLARKLASS